MQAPLYLEINQLSAEILTEAEKGNDKKALKAFKTLQKLCENHAGSELDHPLQWEALGDFSEDDAAALVAYDKGLKCAQTLDLAEYQASIKLAMAEIHWEQRDLSLAQSIAASALSDARYYDNSELKQAIVELLQHIEAQIN